MRCSLVNETCQLLMLSCDTDPSASELGELDAGPMSESELSLESVLCDGFVLVSW